MTESRNFDFLDYLLLLVKRKNLFMIVTFLSLIISYLAIYFFIPTQFKSRSLIVISEGDQTSGLSSLMKSFSSLPVSIPGLKSGGDTDVFTTIIYSRTNLEDVIKKFGLYKEYGYDTMEKTIEELTGSIKADETKEGAYEINVKNHSPQKAAEMVNYIVELLNKTLIELNISKSRDNRMFLGKRYDDLKVKIKLAEDSLVIYQKKSGILYAEDQAKSSFEAYAKLEAELAAKQIEYSILDKLYGNSSPIVETAKISAKEYEVKLNDIKNGKEKSDVILSLKNLPQSAMNYLRYYRDVEIYNKMLAFIIPLYEQSRFEEQKNVPVLKIIDKGIPSKEKAYPPRTLFALLFTSIILMIVFTFFILQEKIKNTTNPKIILIKQNLFKK
jgi:capsule polysaccharide export protein KpsE/RkpR